MICTECSCCSPRKDSVFSCLSQVELDELEHVRSEINYKYGELIFKQGQYPAGIYIITKGKAKIFKYGFEGREQIIQFGKPGDMLGHCAAVSGEKYTCSASAISDLDLCFIPQDFISTLLNSNPALSLRFIKLLACELRAAEEKAVQMAHKPVRERIAEALLLLKEVYGYEEDNITLNINLKRDELAGLAGTVRETATRFLSEFTEAEIISLAGKKIKILDIQRLTRSANHFQSPHAPGQS